MVERKRTLLWCWGRYAAKNTEREVVGINKYFVGFTWVNFGCKSTFSRL